LWEMQPADADEYFGKVLRGAARGTRLSRAQALKTYFLFVTWTQLELSVGRWPGRAAPRAARRDRDDALRLQAFAALAG
jgi:hypothetical protein